MKYWATILGRYLRLWLGIWDVRRWPRCDECKRKATWSVLVDWGGHDQCEWFYCEQHLMEHELGGEARHLIYDGRRQEMK